MARTPRIDFPSARGDAIAFRTLVPLAIACASAGLALAHGVSNAYGGTRTTNAVARPASEEQAPEPVAEVASAMRVPEDARASNTALAPPDPQAPSTDQAPRAAEAPSATKAPSAAQPSAEAPRTTEAPSAEAPRTAEAPSAASGAASAVAAAVDPAPPDRGATSAPGIEPGVFAYLRCDGLAAKAGPFPCPRDRALERRVRSIVENLPKCPEASSIAAGPFEIRAELRRAGTVVEHTVRGPSPAAERAVRLCVGPQLERLQSTLHPDRMIVSTRFNVL